MTDTSPTSLPHSLPHYSIFGSGDTTLFVLHGAYGDGRYFADFATHIADAGYRVVVWDCPGYGTSPGDDLD